MKHCAPVLSLGGHEASMVWPGLPDWYHGWLWLWCFLPWAWPETVCSSKQVQHQYYSYGLQLLYCPQQSHDT